MNPTHRDIRAKLQSMAPQRAVAYIAALELLGTTPEALKADADRIVGAGQNGSQRPQNAKAEGSSKFPRLK